MKEKKTEWATLDTILPEKDLHIAGTIPRAGGKLEFWLFNPPLKECRIRCGICRRSMDGYNHCPNCYPERAEFQGIEEAL